jgi:hypothetical protein
MNKKEQFNEPEKWNSNNSKVREKEDSEKVPDSKWIDLDDYPILTDNEKRLIAESYVYDIDLVKKESMIFQQLDMNNRIC